MIARLTSNLLCTALRKLVIIFLLLVFVPIGASAARYFWMGDGRGNWQTADRSSAGILPLRIPRHSFAFLGRALFGGGVFSRFTLGS